jgi:hypothetical protein
MERTEQPNEQDKQPQTDMDRNEKPQPMAQEDEREDKSVGKVPDPQGEDMEQKREET